MEVDMKNVYLAVLLLISFNVSAQSKLPPLSNLPPMLPGTNTNSIDYSKPGIVIKGNTAYLTHPGTKARDFSKPGYVIESNGVLRPVYLGTNSINRSKPGIVIEGNKAYLTHLGTESPDYSKPGYVKNSSGILRPTLP